MGKIVTKGLGVQAIWKPGKIICETCARDIYFDSYKVLDTQEEIALCMLNEHKLWEGGPIHSQDWHRIK